MSHVVRPWLPLWDWPLVEASHAIHRIRHLRTEPQKSVISERFSTPRSFEQFAARFNAAMPVVEINHRLDWNVARIASNDVDELWILTDWSDDEMESALILQAPLSTLDYSLGPWTFFKWRIRKLQIYAGPILGGAEPPDLFLHKAFAGLAAHLPRWAAIFVFSAPVGSPLHAEITDPAGPIQRHFFVLPWGGEQPHCRITWEGTVDSYLQSIGPESRRNLKRYSKKLLSDHALHCRVLRFSGVHETDRFLRDASRVFAKSYQSSVPGLALSVDSTEGRQITVAAREGSFLGHILYINNEPAAFHYGVIIGDRYFVLQMAYDPMWARHHAGSVLLLEVLKDIERRGPHLRCLDYMGGVTTFKLRTTNHKTTTQSYYLFPRSPAGGLQYASLSLVNAISQAAGVALERTNLKVAVQSLVQRWKRRPSSPGKAAPPGLGERARGMSAE